MPTVEQIWRTLPRKTDVVAGEAGIYNEVNWVVSLKPTPPAFDRLRGKELALIEMATANELGITLSYLVTSLAQQGVSALGVRGNILPADMEIADKLKTPLLHLPQECDIPLLENQVSSLLREERDHLYQLEQELTRELMGLTLAGKGAHAILNKLQSATGRSIILLDPFFKPLSFSGDVPLPDLPLILSSKFQSPPSAITRVRLTEKLSGFLSPVTGKQGNEGYLLVTAPVKEIQESDRVIGKVGALSLAIEISRRQAVEDVEDKFQSEMVESLLNGELPAAAVNERADRLGLDLSQNYAAVAVYVADPQLRGPVIVRKAASIFPRALCHYRADLLIIFYPVVAGIVSADLRGTGREIYRILTARLGAKLSLGMGRAYTGAAGLRTSFQEAERSLAVGKKLFGEGTSSFFGDLGVYRLLLSIGLDELRSFYKDTLGRLVEYERQHEGELMQTLEAILKYPTLAETAKTLHIHRNTLLYRVQRIQEVANVNLDDGETRSMLHLALKAGEVINRS